MRHIQTCIIAWNRGDEASLSVLSCMFVQKGGIRLFKVVHTGDSTLRSYLGTLGPTFSKGALFKVVNTGDSTLRSYHGTLGPTFSKGALFKVVNTGDSTLRSYHGTLGPTFSKVIMVLLGQYSANLSWYYWANIQQSYHGTIGPTFSKGAPVQGGQHRRQHPQGLSNKTVIGALCVSVGQDNDEHLVSVVNTGDVIHRGY